MVRIKEVLNSKGVKQTELAKMMGKSKQTINNWCSGNIPPSLHNIYQIAELLEVPPHELIASFDIPIDQ